MELKLLSHQEVGDSWFKAPKGQAEPMILTRQARLTLKQVVEMLRTVRHHTEFCTERQSFEAVLEQLRKEAEKS